MATITPETPASVGSIRLKLRLRIEAGLADVLTDVGHADMEIPLPVTVMSSFDGSGDSVGATVSIDTRALTSTLTAAAAAFEDAVTRHT